MDSELVVVRTSCPDWWIVMPTVERSPEAAVNSRTFSLPPPPTGRVVTPTRFSFVRVEDLAVSVDGVLGATSPDGALTWFTGVAFFAAFLFPAFLLLPAFVFAGFLPADLAAFAAGWAALPTGVFVLPADWLAEGRTLPFPAPAFPALDEAEGDADGDADADGEEDEEEEEFVPADEHRSPRTQGSPASAIMR